MAYLLAEYGPVSPKTKAIIKAAQKGRVTLSIARGIIEEIEAKHRPTPVELLPEEAEPPKGTLSRAQDRDLVDEGDDDDDDDAPVKSPAPSFDGPEQEQAFLISRVFTLFDQLETVLHDHPNFDLSKVIDDVGGSVRLRGIVNQLKNALDQHGARNVNRAKADAAEAKSKMH